MGQGLVFDQSQHWNSFAVHCRDGMHRGDMAD